LKFVRAMFTSYGMELHDIGQILLTRTASNFSTRAATSRTQKTMSPARKILKDWTPIDSAPEGRVILVIRESGDGASHRRILRTVERRASI